MEFKKLKEPNTELDEKFYKPEITEDLEYELGLFSSNLETSDIKNSLRELEQCLKMIVETKEPV